MEYHCETRTPRSRSIIVDPFKYTTIGHTHMKLCSPLSASRCDTLVDFLALPNPQSVLDIACGKAELSIRVLEQTHGTGVAVDMNPSFLACARAEAQQRLHTDALHCVECDASTYTPDQPADLVMCVGARPYGNRKENLARLRTFAADDGRILVGEGYWRSAPPSEFVDFLGESEEDAAIRFHDLIDIGAELGLHCVHAFETTAEELDRYDGFYAATIEQYIRDHPEDADVDAMQQRVRGWREPFLRYGRDVMGFGWYIFNA